MEVQVSVTDNQAVARTELHVDGVSVEARFAAPFGDQLLKRRGRLVALPCRCIGDHRQDGKSVTHPL